MNRDASLLAHDAFLSPSGETQTADYEFIDLAEFFAGERPLEIEIGCGKANVLAARAQQHPGIHFLGMDRIVKWMKRRKERIDKAGQNNLRLVKAEAREFIERHVPRERVSVFYIYFPDPWPKRRHRKRRLVNAAFLVLLYDRLSCGGMIEIATDDEDYFAAMKKAAGLSGLAWQHVRERINQPFLGGGLKTNYELKYLAQGKAVYYLELAK